VSFKQTVGHEAAIRLFKGQIAQDRVAHTYLLTGPEGIGKAVLALEFAKALQCLKPVNGEACDLCEPCLKIAAGAYPDVMKAGTDSESGQIKIDQVRALEGFMALTPYEGRWKVGILDGADQLTEEATHACLKILEEPPDHSVFMLIASVPYRLPATLVSRCHRVRCAPQGIERVIAHLREKLEVEATVARMAAISSGGRLGLAIQICRTGRLDRKNAFLDLLLQAARRGDLELPAAKLSRQEVAEGLEWVAGWWRDLLVLNLNGEADWVIHQDRLEELKKSAGSFTPERLLGRLERIYGVQEAVQKNASLKNALALLLCDNG